MKTQLIMLSQPILISDEEIKEGVWYFDSTDKEGLYPVYQRSQNLIEKYFGCFKIIAGISELPSIDFSRLSEEDCKKIGWINVEELADKYVKGQPLRNRGVEKDGWNATGFVNGFKTAQSLNEKKFSYDDIRNAFEAGMGFVGEDKGSFKEFIQSLSKPKVFDIKVEVEEKGGDNLTNSFNKKQIYYQQPKITNNSIKIIKIL